MLNNSVYSDFNNKHLINKRLNKKRKTSKISKQLFTTLDQCINTSVDNHSIMSQLTSQTNKANQTHKPVPTAPIVFAKVFLNRKKTKYKFIKILLDSGASSSIAHARLFKNLDTYTDNSTIWNTMAGTLSTSKRGSLSIKMPEFNESATIKIDCHVTNNKSNYDIIVGRDTLCELGIGLDFASNSITWNGSRIDMKPPNCNTTEHYFINDPSNVKEASDRIKRILDAKYEKANLNKLVRDAIYLDSHEQDKLFKLLKKYESVFDGTLGKWIGRPYNVDLRKDAVPYHAKPYSIPKSYEMTLKLEIERLCKLGVLRKINHSEWAAPTFIIPKKDGTVRFISDFRELNKRIKRKPFPIPKIHDLLLKLEGFKYATSLDLNMGYYHIELSPFSKKLCTIVLPWGKYEYQKLPMGLSNSPDIFQEKMNELFSGLEYVRAYIDDLLILTTDNWDTHINQLDEVLNRLQKAGLKVNANKSFFGRSELEYLGFWVTRNGIKPLPKKIEAILKLKPPTTKKQLRSFIGIINYYRDMWIRRSELLAPLTSMTSKEVKFKWTELHQKNLDLIKKVIAKETLLAYPNFNARFDLHTDASQTQLGAVISQDGIPIAFYSRKLNPAQTRYTTTEKELLSIVETLKEFRNILLGQQVRVYTDHKNLTYKQFNTDRVMRWRLIIEEFSPELVYIQGETNIVADALSRLEIIDDVDYNLSDTQNLDTFYADLFDLSDNDIVNPITYKNIMVNQQKDKTLIKNASTDKNYTVNVFHGGETIRRLICYKNKIVIPTTLQRSIVEWYHNHLCHPGIVRTEATIRKHFYWKGLRQTVLDVCSKCHTCQLTKKGKKKYGKLPSKQAEATPWQTLCVDLIGPYKFTQSNKEPIQLWALTMIDPATGWFEIKEIKTKRADIIANLVEQTWLVRYPWPDLIIMDRGREFKAEFYNMITVDYNIKPKVITTRNPQANAIIERVHQTIGNVLRTFDVNKTVLDSDDPWSGILSATGFAIRNTVHTTLLSTPAQLVFGRDSILNITHEANWKLIRDRKQKLINKNNERENRTRKVHKYKTEDLVLIKNEQSTKYGNTAYSGPYTVTSVNDNGTLYVKKGIVTDVINIRNVHPYLSNS